MHKDSNIDLIVISNGFLKSKISIGIDFISLFDTYCTRF